MTKPETETMNIGTTFQDIDDPCTTITITGKPVQRYTYFDYAPFYPVIEKRVGKTVHTSYTKKKLVLTTHLTGNESTGYRLLK